jgi:hypothetical protein
MNRNLYFVSRVAFLYNICLLLTVSMKYFHVIPEGAMKSTVIVAGLILSVLFNAVVMCWMLALLVTGNKSRIIVPGWLITVNTLFFIIQFYLVLK